MDALDQYLQDCGLEESLLNLVRLRASQINGSAYCLDMRWKDLPALEETERRLYSLSVPAINAWNRLSIAARLVPGGYQPAKVAS